MASDLEDIDEGVRYCRKKIADLSEVAAGFMSSGVEDRVRFTGADSGVYEAKLVSDFPPELKREAGMIMNELRAQLDQLANVLGRRNGANADNASFPLVASSININNAARGKVRQLSSADQQKIWSLQPYADPRARPLILLHTADIVRKHRRPLALKLIPQMQVGGTGSLGKLRSFEPVLRDPGKFEPVADFAGAGSAVELGFGVGLIFAEPPELAGSDVISFLHGAADSVAWVIDQFR